MKRYPSLKFTNHLRTRLNQRGISIKTVEEIFGQNLENYWDNLRNHYIVIGKVDYHGKSRKVLAAYDKIGNIVEVITIHPITDAQIKQRLSYGRWHNEEKKQN